MDSVEILVQYIDDVDPFNAMACLKHAEPSSPVRYTFLEGVPLCDQIAGLKKFLKAPQKVPFCRVCSIPKYHYKLLPPPHAARFGSLDFGS